jgi:RNA polymerase sigma factor (sigma-70 family)
VSVPRPQAEKELVVAGLVRAAADGDAVAWDELVDRFGGLVWSITRAFRLSPADAADVSQTVWLRLVEHLDRIREPGRVGAWLAATAQRECLRTLRLARRQLPVGDEVFDSPDVLAAPPYSRLLVSERDLVLWAGFERLPERCRTLLRILVADPTPAYEEVAAATGLPVGSIGPTRARCLAELRRYLGHGGIHDGGDDS